MGGGHVLHMVCDLTIAADNAVFGQTGPKVSLPPLLFHSRYGQMLRKNLLSVGVVGTLLQRQLGVLRMGLKLAFHRCFFTKLHRDGGGYAIRSVREHKTCEG